MGEKCAFCDEKFSYLSPYENHLLEHIIERLDKIEKALKKEPS